MSSALLFTPYHLGSVKLSNRICLSPMCQYSARDGKVNDWHFSHYASMAHGGCGMVMLEATAISPEGRISDGDLGLWEDSQIEGMARIANYLSQTGCVPAIQLAHAGRKSGHHVPWLGGDRIPQQQGGWRSLAPVAKPFNPAHEASEVLSEEQIISLAHKFVAAGLRACHAGYKVIEIHMAHGYLLHQFLSPLVNDRKDGWGGDLQGRMRFALLVAELLRKALPADCSLIARISASDWLDGGWDLKQSVTLCRALKHAGVELIDVSSGGALDNVLIKAEPGYQVEFAATVRKQVPIATAAVGLITEPAQAEQILQQGSADLIFLGRELLRNPNWPIHAARHFGAANPCPKQYLRAYGK